MKNLFLMTVFFLSLSARVSATDFDPVQQTKVLCDVLLKSDRVQFEAMVASREKSMLQWWWDASGKGKYFANLYGGCVFVKLDPKSNDVMKKLFIQRLNKDGKTPWSIPAPVTFELQADKSWKITSYSL